VLDPTRAPIAGAGITVLPGGRLAGPSAVSDQKGEFSLSLDAGNYILKVIADGFQEVSQTVDVFQAGAEPLEFVLQVAGTHNTVTVTDSAGYQMAAISSGTKTLTPLRDVPQSVTVVTRELMADQMMMSMGDVVRYVPGITAIQGENNRDQVVIRGNSSSADFFLDGIRDDVQYYRDLYNVERVEALKGPDAMIFGRGGGGGVINRATKAAEFTPIREVTLLGGSYGNKRFTTDLSQPLNDKVALRFNALYENSGSFRDYVGLKRFGLSPTSGGRAHRPDERSR
jgi:catecholate siderophore receptor